MEDKYMECKSCENHFNTEKCNTCKLIPELDDKLSSYFELWNADPNCKHDIVCASGGGVKCIKCGGWFCF